MKISDARATGDRFYKGVAFALFGSTAFPQSTLHTVAQLVVQLLILVQARRAERDIVIYWKQRDKSPLNRGLATSRLGKAAAKVETQEKCGKQIMSIL